MFQSLLTKIFSRFLSNSFELFNLYYNQALIQASLDMNKQKYASIVGIIVVAVHIGLVFYLWIFFRKAYPDLVAEIATPLTAAFFLGVVKWVIDPPERSLVR